MFRRAHPTTREGRWFGPNPRGGASSPVKAGPFATSEQVGPVHAGAPELAVGEVIRTLHRAHRATVAQLVAGSDSGHHRSWAGVLLGAVLLFSPPGIGAGLDSRTLDGAAAPQVVVSTPASLRRDLHRLPTIPAGASEKFRQIMLKVVPRAHRGTVSAEWMAVSANVADHTVAIEPQQVFRTMGHLIENARYDVAFQTFAWHAESDPAKEIFAAISRLNHNRRSSPEGPPVVVRLLIDTMDSGLNGNGPTSQVMRGIEKAVRALALDPRRVRVEVAAHRHSLVGSLHSKSLVVDGVVAVVTGANANHNDNFDDGEHDAGFVLHGAVARGLLSDFDHAWLSGEVWTCGTEYPRIRTVKGHPGERRQDCLDHPDRIMHLVQPLPKVPRRLEVPMLVLGKPPENNPFDTNEIHNPLAQGILEAFRIGELIRIMTPNLNDQLVVESLTQAVLEGRRVQVLMGRGYEDLGQSAPGQGGTNEEVVAELYQDLQRRGVTDVCERLQIRWYSHDGTKAVEGNGPHATHVKAVWIDDELVLVTSKNMDTQSWRHSREIGVLVDSPEVAQAWVRALFLPDFERSFVVDECRLPKWAAVPAGPSPLIGFGE
jgi:phosphatidylserine/phosphatidylglycerophosphate/cardiolipin synthase-like enzyme